MRRERLIRLSPPTTAKVELYRAARAQGVSNAELARRLGWHGPQVGRLFDLDHRSTITQLDQALRTTGKRLAISIQDAAWQGPSIPQLGLRCCIASASRRPILRSDRKPPP